MLCGPQIVDFTMTTRPKLGLPSKSDNPTSSDRDPARKPVRNSTAKSRTLSRNTTQVAPEALHEDVLQRGADDGEIAAPHHHHRQRQQQGARAERGAAHRGLASM